jgi:antitoxin component of MazEF toxin-antitoxin module
MRVLTVSSQVQERRNSRKCKTSEREVPTIRLSGVWLEQAGYRRGQSVTVTVAEGVITITPTQSTTQTEITESLADLRAHFASVGITPRTP